MDAINELIVAMIIPPSVEENRAESMTRMATSKAAS